MNTRKEKLKKIKFKGEKVFLPFKDEGIVVDYIIHRLDYFPFKVKITTSDIFNDIGTIVEYKSNQITFKNKKLNHFK